MWSLGVTLYQMLTLKLIFDVPTQKEYIEHLRSKDLQISYSDIKSPFWVEVLSWMLQKDPA